MKQQLQIVYLARHGETAWSLTVQHTGLTDLPLTEFGHQTTLRLGERLKGMIFAEVSTSPLQRARETCELTGLGSSANIDPDLVEWDYGKYEGRRERRHPRRAARLELVSRWLPRGRNASRGEARADRVVSRVRTQEADVLLFTSGHFIRVLASRWLGLEPTANFMLSTASLSALG